MPQTPEFRKSLVAEAIEPMPMTPEQFGHYMRQDIAHWTEVVKERNIDVSA
jgi:tripartite-type tricarboxylate transporter receptor subunit TctC